MPARSVGSTHLRARTSPGDGARAEPPQVSLVQLHANPDRTILSRGQTVLVTGLDGLIVDDHHGFFVDQARLLSRYRYTINGNAPESVACSMVEQHSWLGYYIMLPPSAEKLAGSRTRQASQQTLELRVSRRLGHGMREDIALTNHTQSPSRFRFAIELGSDFADQADVDKGRARTLGRIRTRWRNAPRELLFDFLGRHEYHHQGNNGVAELHRALSVRVVHADSPPSRRASTLSFNVDLKPHAQWRLRLEFRSLRRGRWPAPIPRAPVGRPLTARRASLLDHDTRIQADPFSPGPAAVAAAVRRAQLDLASLDLPDINRGPDASVVAAGAPIYLALFGRDMLTTAWQSLLSAADIARGALPEIAAWQGSRTDNWRDEQPGKLMHEAHLSPRAVLRYDPQERYYGSISTSVLFPRVLADLWRWTGDRDAVRPLIDPALRALHWLDQYGDLNGDGFYEYLCRSEQGAKNQGWKDSGDAIVHADGSQVSPPIATCEVQASVYAAKREFSRVLRQLGETRTADALATEARHLKQRFNEVFWMPRERYLAMGLDSRGRQIKSIASDAGHCLMTGILEPDRARAVADRLFEPDLFSGWGIRTLSSAHPAFDPFSYHRGTVWPVEQAIIAAGLARCGFFEHLHRLCLAHFEAATLFPACRLPECISGHPRDAQHPFPAIYPKANSPQAWSASAVLCMVQAMLGISADAPQAQLLVDPHLPPWLPQLTLRGLHIGASRVSIRFQRKPSGATAVSVLESHGPVRIVRARKTASRAPRAV